MAEEKKMEVFPVLPISNWWDLRKRFRQSIPSSITEGYVASTLTMDPKSARYNVLPGLKQTGLISDDGEVKQERAKRWRDDEHYPEVCDEIRKEIYPQELLDAFPKPTEGDRSAVARWFANRAGLGTVAVNKMATFYLMLSEADPTKMAEPAKLKVEKLKTKPKVEPKVKVTEKKEPIDTKVSVGVEEGLNIPSININIEVHISSDASETQIDNIFASMAKHLNIRRKIANE